MGTVSVVIPYDDRWYFSEILRGLTDRVEAAGHTPVVHVISPGPDATAEAVAAVERDFADDDSIGAIAAGIRYRPEQSTRILRFARPLVIVGGSVLGFPTVGIDDVGVGMIATHHVLALGHRKVVHLAGRLSGQMDFAVNGRRAKGYQRAMESAGIDPVLVEVDYDEDAAKEAALELLDKVNPPTAIVAVSDQIAFGVLDAMRDLGLQPGVDVSVIGADDQPRAEEEDLTTIRQRPAEMGAMATELLLSGLGSGPDPRRSRLHAVGLVQRGSTRRLRPL